MANFENRQRPRYALVKIRAAKQEYFQEESMTLMNNGKLIVLRVILTVLAVTGSFGLVVMMLRNWLMPDIFGLKAISYLQA